MPLYNLACKAALDIDQRQRIAEVITRTHCELTGAPAQFVNVAFMEGFPLRKDEFLNVVGGVRSGGNRDLELDAKLQEMMQKNIANAANVTVSAVRITLIGVPGNWNMEGGKVLPEPGAEDEWLDRSEQA
jgi:hypothetical protein